LVYQQPRFTHLRALGESSVRVAGMGGGIQDHRGVGIYPNDVLSLEIRRASSSLTSLLNNLPTLDLGSMSLNSM